MIDGLVAYEEYQDSGQEWLGKVPRHWELKPGHVAFGNQSVSNMGLKEATVLSLSYGKIKVKPTDKQHGLVPASYETYQIVDKGNIIIRGTDLQNDKTSLRIGLVRDRGIISSAYICLKAKDPISPEYGYEMLNIFDLTKAIYRYGSGLRQNLDFGEIKRLPIFIPPPDEQTAIVKFLQYVNLRLNGFVAAKRKLIRLLNEQKYTIVQQAITRGLDLNVPTKESQISWLSGVPENWNVLRSKYIFREVDDRSEDGSETHLSMSQKFGLIPNSELTSRRLVSDSYAGAKLCRSGDLVLNRLKAHLGVFALSPQNGLVSPDYTVLRPIRQIEPRYFEALYRSPACRVELRSRAKGIVQGFWRLYTDDFYDIKVPIPPLTEQVLIMNYLDEALIQQNTGIARIEREIALIQEYRIRLATGIVTGKYDVREAASRLPIEFTADLNHLGSATVIDEDSLDSEVEDTDE